MPRLHALELVPDDAGQDAVRRDWQRLRDAGLPSQLDHDAPTNAPHVTVVSAPYLPDEALDVAHARLGALLPIRARAAGLLVLGGSRVTIARAVDIDDDVVRRALAVRVQVPDRQHVGWLPHVTLARRVDRSLVQQVLDAVGHEDVVLTLTELRRWDPEKKFVTTIAQA
ncbi:2'-5' RNA ligase family protein [Nocardioides caricicola]|uniref:2'-5' RNA ligase family protein n=1 Tax=Nocardioides caricicola TaxID=634770 RepID=A0ABW0MXG6_9ACTN